MKRQLFLATGAAALSVVTVRRRASAAAKSAKPIYLQPSLRDALTTRAERTDFKESSTYDDVTALIDALDKRGAPIFRGSLGSSAQGRDIPYVVASRPRITTPREARDSGRAIVYLQATVDGGMVDGKEALLSMLRDLCISTQKTLLDDLVLLIVPMVNPDGNERTGNQSVNRPEQDGPASVGVAQNGAGLDLDRDYVKCEAPETRGCLELIKAWNPDVMIDCRTTDGSYSGYDLTYAPSLHPAAFAGGPYARDTIFPAVHRELQDKFGISTFEFGNFGRSKTLELPAPPNSPEYGWFVRDYRPRSATNYYGLRGRIAIAANSYAHDTFEARIFATRAFVETTLGFVSTNDDQIIRVSQLADNFVGGAIPIRAALPASPPRSENVQWELLTPDPGGGEPGLPPGLKRSGNYNKAAMPIYDRFTGTAFAQAKGYLIRYSAAAVLLPLLRTHGVLYEQLVEPTKLRGSAYVIDRIAQGSGAEQGGRDVVLTGRWAAPDDIATRFGDVRVPIEQTLGPLAACLLEPEAADGFATWGLLDGQLETGSAYPVFRLE